MAQYQEKRYLSVAETAKLLRPELAQAFPGIKFSVRSKSYSGGASITVEWMDGPTNEQVKKITRQFEGATFDSMQDLKEYKSSMLNGELVHFGADYINLHRSFSVAFLTEVAAKVCKDFGKPMPKILASDYFGASVERDESIRIGTRALDQEINWQAHQTPGPMPTAQAKASETPQTTNTDQRVRHFGDWTWIHIEESLAHDAMLFPLGFQWSKKRHAYYAKSHVEIDAIVSALQA